MAPLAFAEAVQETLEKVLALPVERGMTLLSYYLTILLSYYLTISTLVSSPSRSLLTYNMHTILLSYYPTISLHY